MRRDAGPRLVCHGGRGCKGSRALRAGVTCALRARVGAGICGGARVRGGGGYIKRASIIMRGGPVPTSPERFWIGLG
jgi:hypothetical protein